MIDTFIYSLYCNERVIVIYNVVLPRLILIGD